MYNGYGYDDGNSRSRNVIPINNLSNGMNDMKEAYS